MQLHTSLKINTNLLKGRSVFLSASIPEKRSSYPEFEKREIIDAVVAFSRATLDSGGRLVFGGHPTISPLILHVATQERRRIGSQEHLVDVYQSRWFEDVIPECTRRLVGLEEVPGAQIAKLYYTPRMSTEKESLEEMRRIMLIERNPCCAIFIGGKDGIIEEFDMFTRYYTSRPVYCIGSPGGSSCQLAKSIFKNEKNIKWNYLRVNKRDLLFSKHYPLLAADVILDRVAKLSFDEAFTMFCLMAITKKTNEKAVHLKILSERLHRGLVSVKSDLEELFRMNLVATYQEPIRIRAPSGIEVQRWETRIDVNDANEIKLLLDSHPEIVDYVGKQRIAQSFGI